MKQKLFTLFLALVASVSAIYAQSGTCGDNLTWTLADSVLTISGTGAMENFAYTACIPWYDYRSSIKSVIISDGVTSIGDWAFGDCSSLTSVTIGNSVTSIGGFAFSLCTSFTSVTIPNSVTSIGQAAFIACTSLTSLTIPNSVTNIEKHAFAACAALPSVTIPNSVISIGKYAFLDCISLTSIRWNAKNCNSYNFGNQVTSFTFGNEVEVIPDSLCMDMNHLNSITIPNSVKSIGANAFKGCRQLYSIYCYAAMPPMAYESSFENYNAYLYVPCESQRYYQADMVWSKFPNTQCISSENVITDEIVVTPFENEVEIAWPVVNEAVTYKLVIKDKDGNVICTLIFNANGQLTSMAFNAPSRNGVPAQTQSAGFSFTITGLNSGTGYDLTLTAKDNSGNIIEETTIPFHTDYPEGIEDIQSDEVQSTKVIKDGQVLILRNGKTYTMQGQEMK